MAETDSAFDVRIVNPLERPRSEDFNLAQAAARTTSQAVAAMAFPTSGAVKIAFAERGFRPQPLATPSRAIRLFPGQGLSDFAQSFSSINGIPGVDLSGSGSRTPLVLSAFKEIAVPPAPPAGRCRRDVVAVRAMSPDTIVLTDQQATDVFNAANQVFEPSMRYKTLSFDYKDVAVHYMAPGASDPVPVPNPPMIYIPGIEYDYEGPATFYALATTQRSPIPAGYTLIAAINVEPDAVAITEEHICDFRALLFPNNTHTFPVRFRAGASDTNPPIPGADLVFATTESGRVPGIADYTMIKTGGGSDNLFALVIPGLFNLRAANAVAALAALSPNANVAVGGFEVVQVNNYDVQLSQELAGTMYGLATAQQKADLADPTLTPNPITVAVGQPLTSISIALGCLNWDYHRIDYRATVFGYFSELDPVRNVYVSGAITLSY